MVQLSACEGLSIQRISGPRSKVSDLPMSLLLWVKMCFIHCSSTVACDAPPRMHVELPAPRPGKLEGGNTGSCRDAKWATSSSVARVWSPAAIAAEKSFRPG
jgi:hypothetical protein